MVLTESERALLLAGLFELHITHIENADRCAAIDALAAKLGGDPTAVLYGVEPTAF
jgi:hypothetical protein